MRTGRAVRSWLVIIHVERSEHTALSITLWSSTILLLITDLPARWKRTHRDQLILVSLPSNNWSWRRCTQVLFLVTCQCYHICINVVCSALLNPLSPDDELKNNFTSPKTNLIFLQLRDFVRKISIKLFYLYIGFSIVHPHQVIFIHYKSRIATAIREL